MKRGKRGGQEIEDDRKAAACIGTSNSDEEPEEWEQEREREREGHEKRDPAAAGKSSR